MPDLKSRLERVTDEIQFDQADLARVLNTNPRTVARWTTGESAPRPDARLRLLEVLAVLEQLSSVLKADAAHDWLFSPNPLLEHHKPVEVLAEGDFRRVLAAIEVMADGVFL